MIRDNHLLERIADPDNLRLASWKAAKGKRYAASVLAYQRELEQNLFKLRAQILSGRVEVGRYRYFKVYEPKERQICASAFSEQVLHHALMNICHDRFERSLIFDSYASRKGKGVYAALERARNFTDRHGCYLKLDVKKFFDSVHHAVLKRQLAGLFKEKTLLSIFYQIIDSYAVSPERGLPIGNLTSQYFANHYLSGLDHYIKEKMGVSAYVRYMDDLVLWHQCKEQLWIWYAQLSRFLEDNLQCSFKPVLLHSVGHGVPFLGYKIFPGEVRLLPKSKTRFARKIKSIEARYQNGEWDDKTCQNHALPLVAFARHASSNNFRRSVLLQE